MTSQPLDLTISRKGRPYDVIQATADPANPAELREILVQWLTGKRWGEILWPQFEITARAVGRSKKLATVRTT
jgi:hypothetical protein